MSLHEAISECCSKGYLYTLYGLYDMYFVVIHALFYVIRSKDLQISKWFLNYVKTSLRFIFIGRDGCGDSIANHHHQFSFYQRWFAKLIEIRVTLQINRLKFYRNYSWSFWITLMASRSKLAKHLCGELRDFRGTIYYFISMKITNGVKVAAGFVLVLVF